ncbi:hypothetical protein SAMN05421640_0081 [Ekhidna lutea]|uniref:Uncharacterized protein n=1 Tax=Ekhidna lutea TaxID=447679 RepID=A0A239ECU4_EKHLU|nr:prealbumin-like fold domain-containing protein [Ekhidna lutea]SNS42427.1 hypothetical protein SAMN05421640_0081 [Ekhidna lutea]
MKNLLITFSVIISSILPACDTTLSFDERGIMIVEVVNNGTPQSDVDLTLYRTVDDWAFDENRLGVYKTSENGAVAIPRLDAGEYYIDAVFDNLNNWQTPYALYVEDGTIYHNGVEIHETVDGYISNAEGIAWSISQVLDENGDPHSSRECEINDIVMFTRAGAYERTDINDDCGTSFVEGSWWGVGTDELWLLLDEGATVIPTTVTSLSYSSFRLTYFIDSEWLTYVFERQ